MKLARLLLLFALSAVALPDTVRVTATGARYHRVACPSIRAASYLVRRTAADSAGYAPCRRCLTAPPRRPSRFLQVKP